MPRALLVGDFGQPEPGSEALIEAFVSSLPEDWSSIVTSSDPWITASRHDVDAVPPLNARSAPRQARSVDAVVLAGGSPLRSRGPRTGRPVSERVRSIAPLSVAAQALGKPVAGVGVGADSLPGRSSRAVARGLVRQADLLVLRDEESADALADAGAHPPFRVGADPTWALLDEPVTQTAASPRAVRVVLQHPAEPPFDSDFLVEGLAAVQGGGLQIELQPWFVTDDGADDLTLALQVAGRLPGAVILDPPAGLIEARDSMASSHVVVGMRFHALLAAASAGAPFVALSPTPGPRGLARRFTQQALAHDATPARLAEAVFAAAAGPAPGAAAVRSEIASAEEGFRLLRLLLDEGRSEGADEITGLPLRPATWVQ